MADPEKVSISPLTQNSEPPASASSPVPAAAASAAVSPALTTPPEPVEPDASEDSEVSQELPPQVGLLLLRMQSDDGKMSLTVFDAKPKVRRLVRLMSRCPDTGEVDNFWPAETVKGMNIGGELVFVAEDDNGDDLEGPPVPLLAHGVVDRICDSNSVRPSDGVEYTEMYSLLEQFAQTDPTRWLQASADGLAGAEAAPVMLVLGTLVCVRGDLRGICHADLWSGDRWLRDVPVPVPDLPDLKLPDRDAPGVIALGLARKRGFAARHNSPVELVGFFPKRRKVSADDCPLGKLTVVGLCRMAGLLPHTSMTGSERAGELGALEHFLTRLVVDMVEAEHRDEMRAFGAAFAAFMRKHVKFVWQHGCFVLCFPTPEDAAVCSLAIVIPKGEAPLAVFAARLPSELCEGSGEVTKAIMTGMRTTSTPDLFLDFVNAVVTAAGQGKLVDVQRPCDECSLLEAACSYVFSVWADTGAASQCPECFPALLMSFRLELLRAQTDRLEAHCYCRRNVELLFRVTQHLAGSIRAFQESYGFGQWDTEQGANNNALRAQVGAWEQSIDDAAATLKRMATTRGVLLTKRFALPSAELRATNTQIQKLTDLWGLGCEEVPERDGCSPKGLAERCRQLTGDAFVLYCPSELASCPLWFNEQCRAFANVSAKKSSAELVLQFQALVLEVARRSPEFFADVDNVSKLDERAVRDALKHYRRQASELRAAGDTSFSRQPELQVAKEALVAAAGYCFVYSKMRRHSYADVFKEDFGPAFDVGRLKLRHLSFSSPQLEQVALQLHDFCQSELDGAAPVFNIAHPQGTLDFCDRLASLRMTARFEAEERNDAARMGWRENELERRKSKIQRLEAEIAAVLPHIANHGDEVVRLQNQMPPQFLYSTAKSRRENPDWVLQRARLRDVEWRLECFQKEDALLVIHAPQVREGFKPELRTVLNDWLRTPFSSDSVEAERENTPISEQHLCPDDWTEQEFQVLGTLRCFTTPQLVRNMLKLLRTLAAPLTDCIVHQVVRASLYQLGPVHESKRRLWRELDEAPELEGELLAVMHDLLAQFRETRRAHAAYTLLLDLGLYMLPRDPTLPVFELAHGCVDAALEFLKQRQAEPSEDTSESIQLRHLAAQHLLYAQGAFLRALRCTCSGVASRIEVGKLVLHILDTTVLLREARVDNPGLVTNADVGANLLWIYEALEQRCNIEFSECLGMICDHIDDAVLTEVIRRTVDERDLEDLTWTLEWRPRCAAKRQAIAHAVDPRGTAYALNVRTGDVLVNGKLRDRLPAAVREDPTFRRTFLGFDFRIVCSADGASVTARTFRGSRFEFRLHKDGQVKCIEVCSSGLRFEVLPLEEARRLLPPSIAERFTHWRCETHDLLLCRSLLDVQRSRQTGALFEETAFVASRASSGRWQFLPVPRHLSAGFLENADVLAHIKAGSLAQLLLRESKETRQLVRAGVSDSPALAQLLAVFAKFEPESAFVDIYACVEEVEQERPHVFEVEFVRFGLRFGLRKAGLASGRVCVVSREYAGYRLADEQALPGNLLAQFTNYLLLERLDEGQVQLDRFLVLVPDGWVSIDTCSDNSKPIESTPFVDASLTPTASVPAECARDRAHGVRRPHSFLRRDPDRDWGARKHLALPLRCGELQARSLAAWLQLACLHLVSDSPVPDEASGAFPFETAVRILRNTLANRPLCGGELYKVLNLVCVANAEIDRCVELADASQGARVANVLLLAERLYQFSHALHFCHPTDSDEWAASLREDISEKVVKLRAQAVAWYPLCPRFTDVEKRELFGHAQRAERNDLVERRLGFGTSALRPHPTDSRFVAECEARLQKRLLRRTMGTGGAEMPNRRRLARAANESRLAARFLAELQASWVVFQREERLELVDIGADALVRFLRTERDACLREWRACLVYIMATLRANPADHPCGATEAELRAVAVMSLFERLHATGERFPSAAENTDEAPLRTILELFLERDRIARLNPFLQTDAIKEVHRVLRLFLELEVLREKFARLLAQHCGVSEAMAVGAVHLDVRQAVERNRGFIARELECVRTWNTAEHPEWLAFEVEQRLQIRPQQHDVARLCIDEPGAIAQLNMGEGKTRVILPMLVLHFTSSEMRKRRAPSPIIRLTILPTLLGEFVGHLTQALQQSVLSRRIYVAPFCRDVDLAPLGHDSDLRCPRNAKQLRDVFVECAKAGGVLAETPESRLSKVLKLYELQLEAMEARSRCSADTELERAIGFLREVVYFPAVDVLDEADEELRQKFQLVYAMRHPDGTTLALDCGETRWRVLQALLRLLGGGCDAVERFLAEHAEVCWLGASQDCGTFRPLRFLAAHQNWPDVRGQLAALLLDILLDSPPLELGALASLTKQQRTFARRFVLHPEDAAVSGENLWRQIEKSQPRSQLLTLRGMLGTGVLWHALEKRHRVDFGLRLVPGGLRMAVPYRATDTPAERAEYGHPDVALVLTHLSWYYDGLSCDEFRQATEALLRMGAVAREQLYNTWLRGASHTLPPKDLSRIDRVDKVELDNNSQFDLLFQAFARNAEVVNHFLHACVLPSETRQFPAKLTASAFDLAHSHGHTIGFSGTKDASVVLPPMVKQRTLQHLLGTDGRMLACVIKGANSTYHAGPASVGWRATLDAALRSDKSVALIEAGGLLAGACNRDIAERILRMKVLKDPLQTLRGVVYFDPSRESAGQWMVVDRKLVHECLAKSALREEDCFAFYDQARTRGADLQLAHDARALVTVGPGMSKDQLMQAVGRLRKVHFGQTVAFYGPPEVSDAIRQTCRQCSDGLPNVDQKLTSEDLLLWVTLNAVHTLEAALVPWAAQGAIYCATRGDAACALLDEHSDLKTLYGECTAPQFIREAGKADFEKRMRRAGRREPPTTAASSTAPSTTSRRSRRRRARPRPPGPSGSDDILASPAFPLAAAPYELASVLNVCDRPDARDAFAGDQLQVCFDDTERGILEVLEEFGGDHQVTRSALDDECERELEHEDEQEVERELPSPEKPAASMEWDFKALVEGREVEKFFATQTRMAATVFAETEFASLFVAGKADDIFEGLWATKDFHATLERQLNTVSSGLFSASAGAPTFRGMAKYLRPVNAVLLVRGRVVCATDREGGLVLDLMYGHGREFYASSGDPSCLFLVTHVPNGVMPGTLAEVAGSATAMMPVNACGTAVASATLLEAFPPRAEAALQLFNGESNFPRTEARACVKEFFQKRDDKQRAALSDMLRAVRAMRGREREFERSHLDELQRNFGVEPASWHVGDNINDRLKD